MIGIVFTTTEEAAPFVRQHTDGRIEALEEGTPIQTSNLVVAVTGEGKIKATLSTERLLHRYDVGSLLHTGACTALNEELSVGTVIGASFVLEGDRVELDEPTYPRMPLEPPLAASAEGTLVSQDHTSQTEENSYWERIADVRDGTGYAVAYVAGQHGTPCRIAKVVEDHSEKREGSTSEAPTVIASFLQRVLEEKSESLH